MALFDLKVRLIPDASQLKKELRKQQRGAGSSAAGSVGSAALGGAVGAEAAHLGDVKVSGFGKMLGLLGGISLILKGLQPFLEPVVKLLSLLILTFFLPFKDVWAKALKKLAEGIVASAATVENSGEMINSAVAIVAGSGEKMGTELDNIRENLKQGFMNVVENFKQGNIIGGIISGINFALSSLITFIIVGGATIGKGLAWIVLKMWDFQQWIASLPEKLWEFLKKGFEWFMDVGPRLWEIIKSPFEWLRDKLSSVIKSISGFFGGGKKGGSTSGDDFILRPDGKLIKTNPGDTIMGFKGNTPPGGTGGGSVTINFNNPVVRQDSDLQKLAQEISRIMAVQNRRRFS